METHPGQQPTPLDIDRENPAVIIYTSGSTGTPKGTIISHRALVSNAVYTIPSWNLTASDRTLTVPPMFHTAGLFALVTPILMAGGQIVIQPKFLAEETFELIKTYRPTKIFMVLTMYYDMMLKPSINIAEMTSVDLFISGGASLSPEVYHAFKKLELPLTDSYGLTECGPNNFTIDPVAARQKEGSVGKPNIFSKVRIVDHANQDVMPGEIGELLIGGDHAFSGYWNNHDATVAAFHEGYVRTGDFARMDADGDYYIVGRKKEMIITGGENVYPSEVEKVVNAHPDVLDAIVVGYPNTKWGESVACALILKEPGTFDEEALKAYCKERLAIYKTPKLYIELDEFPRNAVGKINKRELVKMFIEKSEQLAV